MPRAQDEHECQHGDRDQQPGNNRRLHQPARMFLPKRSADERKGAQHHCEQKRDDDDKNTQDPDRLLVVRHPARSVPLLEPESAAPIAANSRWSRQPRYQSEELFACGSTVV